MDKTTVRKVRDFLATTAPEDMDSGILAEWVATLDTALATITLRDFSKTDWYGFAGASRFPDGREPLLADGDFIDSYKPLQLSYILVVDANGIAVMVMNDEGADVANYNLWANKLTREALSAIAQALPSTLSAEALQTYGFEKE